VKHEDICLALGSYLLGSLCSSEHAEFARHLTRCPPCRAELAELAPLLVLLSQVDAVDVRHKAVDGVRSSYCGSSRLPSSSRRPTGEGRCTGRPQPRWAWWWKV
jgi:Putative zinc-finger